MSGLIRLHCNSKMKKVIFRLVEVWTFFKNVFRQNSFVLISCNLYTNRKHNIFMKCKQWVFFFWFFVVFFYIKFRSSLDVDVLSGG